MIPRFRLERPRSVDEALAAFGADPDGSAYLAGGTELLQVMKMGLTSIGTLVDLKAIDALRGLRVEADGTLVIGALATHREIERSDEVAGHTPALAAMARRVANVRVRSTGTLGGNLCFAEPHSDPATLLLACDGTIELVGPAGRRTLGIDEFVAGPLVTAREPEEIALAVRVPRPPAGTGVAYERLAFFERPAASVAVRANVADGAIRAAAIAVGSLTDSPRLLPDAGTALEGAAVDELPARIGALAAQLAAPIDTFADLNGSAEYKRHLAGLLIQRATLRAVGLAA